MTEKCVIDRKKCVSAYEDNKFEETSFLNRNTTFAPYANANKPHIVVVEDEPGIAICFKLRLDLYFKLKILTNAEDALAYIRANYQEINLIILDYQLPGMDGLELISIIRKDTTLSYLPIILQTATDKSLLDLVTIKANYFLQKPWTMQAMQSAIARVLGQFP